VDHLPEEHKPAVKKKLQNAYAMTEYADAKRALERLHRELMAPQNGHLLLSSVVLALFSHTFAPLS